MPTFRFSKLVRDRIVEGQIAAGAKPNYRRLSRDEHKFALINKLAEEAEEIREASPDEVVAEIADVQQVLDDLLQLYDLTAEDVAAAQARKNEKNGAFKEGLFVESVEVADDNPWVEYYRKNADRYPEM